MKDMNIGHKIEVLLQMIQKSVIITYCEHCCCHRLLQEVYVEKETFRALEKMSDTWRLLTQHTWCILFFILTLFEEHEILKKETKTSVPVWISLMSRKYLHFFVTWQQSIVWCSWLRSKTICPQFMLTFYQ